MDVSNLCRLIRATPLARFRVDGATEEDVADLEEQLKVALPLEYRVFLRELGYAVWNGWVINGVSGIDDFDVIQSTTWRRSARDYLPADRQTIPLTGVVVGPEPTGGDYFLHDERSETPGRVSLYLDENMGGEEKSWDSFREFLEDLVLRNNG